MAKETSCSNERIHKRGHWECEERKTQLVAVACNYNGLVLLKKKLVSIPRILTVIVPEELVFSSCEQYHIQLCLSKFKCPSLTTLTLLNKTMEPIVITRGCVIFFLCRKHIL